MSALTSSAPSLAKPFALALFTSLVSTRAAKIRFGSLRIARTKPPPCASVAPTTAITFLLLIATLFLPHRRLHRGYISSVFATRSVNPTKDVELYLYVWHRVEFRHFSLAMSGVLETPYC